MKKHSTLFLSALALLVGASCSSDDDLEDHLAQQELTDIRVVAPNFKLAQPNSRLAIDVERGFYVEWTAQDTMSIIPNEGAQVPFPVILNGGSDNKAVTFTGGGWSLKPASTYSAYYPYVNDIHLDKTNIPVSFLGQWQDNNTDTKNLTSYIYMGVVASTPVEGKVDMQFQHLACLTGFEINTPEPTAFSSITFVANEKLFVHRAKLDMTQSSLALQPTVTSDTLQMRLDGLKTTAENLKANLYFMFAPTQMKGKTIKAILRDTDGYEEEIVIEGRDLEAGNAYKFANLNYVTYPTVAAPNWNFDESANHFQTGMTTVVTLPSSMKKLMGNGDELAAFVNGELRGVGKAIKGNFYLMVHGDIGETNKVSFKYYNQKKQYLYEAKDVVKFNSDTVFGTADHPKVLPLNLVK